jgi:hypothetical protein
MRERGRGARAGFIFKVLLFRYVLFVRFIAWTFALHCVCEYIDVVIFVSLFACSLVPRTVLRA